jgi:hypothetical protein
MAVSASAVVMTSADRITIVTVPMRVILSADSSDTHSVIPTSLPIRDCASSALKSALYSLTLIRLPLCSLRLTCYDKGNIC